MGGGGVWGDGGVIGWVVECGCVWLKSVAVVGVWLRCVVVWV